ncbi:transglycosylase SLT domain-containing protein [Loigolactobacillus coryniformis]|uniref:transglycosylase SLT domain-containing protein n=1 Tax=Loigolactobacillus coryniformis TaxID=1610 RepID=UPI00201AA885|nr:transglycosylase SLT domain-containing protein [Loigolactobacillus coryniformis]MCL5458094.1 transglycosylase SLT domain-containing protein [Loigolactobacillus coryniformis]
MADGIDIGDLESRFNLDLSGLKQMTDQAAKMFEKLSDTVKQSSAKAGKDASAGIDISKAVTKLSEQVTKMNENMSQGFAKMHETATKGSANLSDGVTKNTTKMRTTVGKDIDKMVRDIDAKMEQAKAAQLKLQSLSFKRAAAQSSGDTGKALQFDSQIAGAQAQMQRYQNQAKDLAQSMSRELDAVPASFKKIDGAMSQNESKIEQLRAKVKSLSAAYEQQRVPVGGNFESGFDMGDSKQSLKTKEQIEKLQGSMSKLISENDYLAQSYANTEDRASGLRNALKSVNTELDKEAISGRMAAAGVNAGSDGSGGRGGNGGKKSTQSGGFFNNLRNSTSGFFDRFRSGSNEVQVGSSRIERSLGGIGRSLKMVGSQVFLFSLLGQGLMSLVGWLWSAANTNSQFASSFNQVYVNLLTAFYPIYTAVMPALNTLMAGLAKATGVLASFIANLFGTTYSAAKQGASGLQSSIQSLNATSAGTTGVSKAANNAKQLANNTSDATKKAKELQQSLASFDEINTLQQNNDDESGTGSTPDAYTPDTSTPDAGAAESPLGGADFGAATGNYSTPAWLKAFADAVKAIAKDLWTPIAEAWDAVGDKVVKAFKYALGELLGLVEAIGKSFLKVWDNGTGEKFVENLLILLADVLNIIGDIAKAFKDAWNDDGRGTRLIQTFFDAFNAILELLHSIAVAFREAWNSGVGESIAANILDIFTNIFKTIENIADRLKTAWNDNGTGEKIFGTILGMVDDILSAINRASKATADWAGSLDFGPLLKSVDSLLEALRPFAKNIWDGLEWGYKNLLLPLAKFTIEKVLPDFFDVLTGILKVFNAVINDLKPEGEWLFSNLLKPLASWAGGAFHSIMQKIVDILSAFSDWASKHKVIVDTIVTSLAALLALKVASGWLSSATGTLGKLVDAAVKIGGKEHVLRDFFKGVTGIDKLEGAVTQLKNMWKIVSENWQDSSMFKAFKSGPLQSIKGTGGVSGLTTGGKALTGLAGAGVVLGAGWDIVSAIKEKNPTKKFEDFGSGAGTAIGGGIGLFFGGPLGAAIGSQIGGVIGKWAGDGAKKFSDGWNAVGKGKKPDDWLGGLGWDAKQMTKKVGDWWDGLQKTNDQARVEQLKAQQKADKEFKKSWDEFWSGLGKKASDMWTGITTTASTWSTSFSKWWAKSSKNLGKDWNQFWGDAGSTASGIWDTILNTGASWITNFSKWWAKSSKTLGKNWNQFWSDTGTTVSNMWDGAKNTASNWGTNFSKWWAATSSSFGKKWNSFWSDTGTFLKNTWQTAKTNTANIFGQIADKTSSTWSDIKNNVSSLAGKAKDGAVSAWSTLKSRTSSSWSDIKSTVSNLAGRAKDGAISAWSTLQSRTPGFFNNVKNSAKSAFDTVAGWAGNLGSRIGGGLSGGYSAVKRGAARIANGIIGVIGGAVNGVIRGINWVLSKVGSGNRLSAWSVPSFATGGRHKGGPALVNDATGPIYREAYRLPDGRSGLFPAQHNLLLNLPAGAQIMPAQRVAQKMAARIPHYANGLFDFDFDFKMPKLDFSGLNFDFKMPKLDFSGLNFNFGSIGNIFSSAGSFVGDAVGDATDWLTKYIGNPKGLWNWVVQKYAGLAGKTGIGVDVAHGTINKMAGGATSMLKKALESFAPADPGGSGVVRWRPYVLRALSKLGLSSGLVNKVLAQINTESGGNAKAMGGNDGLADGNAMGLMQVKPGTFAAYKLPGHGNIWNGYDNMLAGLNYARNRYGSNLSFLGQGHGYANGGLISQDGMYRVGEHDLSEMVIPLTKPARAVELMQEGLSMMGLSGYDLVTPEIANEPNLTSGLSNANSGVTTTGLSAMDAQTIGRIIAETIAELFGDQQGSGDTDMNVSMQVNDDTLAQIVIKAVNRRIKKLGYNPIII